MRWYVHCIGFLLALPCNAQDSITFEWTVDSAQLIVDDRPVNAALAVISEMTGIPILVDPADTNRLDGVYRKRKLEDLLEAVSPGVAITYVFNERIDDYLIDRVVTSRGTDAATKQQIARDIKIANENLATKLDIRTRQPIKYSGIGASIAPGPDASSIWVKPLTPDSPAARAGLRLGDQVTAINNVPVSAFTNIADVSASIRGPVNSEVQLTVLHPDGSRTIKSIRRGVVDVKPKTE